MPQVFSADAQSNQNAVDFTSSPPVPIIDTNPLQPPFQTCKAKIFAWAVVALDATETEIVLSLIRNPESDNVTVADVAMVVVAGQIPQALVTVAGTDQVPDPRAVSYELQLRGTTNTGNNQSTAAYIEATLISG